MSLKLGTLGMSWNGVVRRESAIAVHKCVEPSKLLGFDVKREVINAANM